MLTSSFGWMPKASRAQSGLATVSFDGWMGFLAFSADGSDSDFVGCILVANMGLPWL
jgi:hypothetical protein